jgi:hypothetical protein
MRCDRCGREIPPDEGPFFTTEDEQIETPGVFGAKTRTHPLMLCPTCAARRRGTELWFLWMIIAIAAGLLLCGLVLNHQWKS